MIHPYMLHPYMLYPYMIHPYRCDILSLIYVPIIFLLVSFSIRSQIAGLPDLSPLPSHLFSKKLTGS